MNPAPCDVIDDLIRDIISATVRSTTAADESLDEDTPTGRITREFLARNWTEARDGLLAKTKLIHVEPEASATPRVFRFWIDRPYKRQPRPDAIVELASGPIVGTIYYRHSMFRREDQDVPTVAVELADRCLLHPNFSRRYGMLCLGTLPPGPLALSRLLEHVYRILAYANARLTHPADMEAAQYFASPDAMWGLDQVAPLY